MKRLILILLIAGLALGTGDNFPIIRSTLIGGIREAQVRKFDDGPNTCYVVTTATYQGVATAISCVKR
jgi:hypothetical protein